MSESTSMSFDISSRMPGRCTLTTTSRPSRSAARWTCPNDAAEMGTGSNSEKARDMLHFDLENENETVRNYRDRVRQCEALGEFAMAEQIRQILMQEQDHQIDLATALGEDVPNVNSGPAQRSQPKRR